MSTETISIKTLGRPPIEAGPAWDARGNISLPWLRWFNGVTQLIKITASGSSILVTSIDGIAGLISSGQLSVDNPNTFVYVTDFAHLMIWDGDNLNFADGGCNYYSYSDHPPDTTGWVECAGQEVEYMIAVAPYKATKTLPDTLSQVSFLSFGAVGDGSFKAAVAPTITGTAAITGTASVSVSVSGPVTISSVSVSGSTSAGTTGTGTTGTGSTGTGTSGSTAPGFTGGGTLSGNTGFANANLDSAAFTCMGVTSTDAVPVTGDVGGSISGGSSTDSTDLGTITSDTGNLNPGTTNSGTVDEAQVGAGFFAFESSGFSVSISAPDHTHDVVIGSHSHTLPSLSGSGLTWSQTGTGDHNHDAGSIAAVGPATGQVAHDHDLSGASVSISGTVASHTHTIPALSVPGLSIPGLSIPSLSLTATGTGTGTFSGTGTGTGSISGSGPITATAGLNGTPRAWQMIAWFRQ